MTNRNAVLIIADQKQFPPAVFLAERLVSLNRRPDTDVILATDSERRLADAEHYGEKFILLDFRRLHDDLNLPTRGYLTKATYFSLFVPTLLFDRYDRILYLDVDTYPQSAAVFNLFDLEMGPYAIAAARDLNIPFMPNPANDAELRETLQLPRERRLAAKYLNSGVLLIDRDAYKRQHLEKQALKIIRDKRARLQWLDQTIFNTILHTRWLELSPSFNMITRAWASFICQFSPPAVVHFTGSVKPWHRAFVDEHPVRRELVTFLNNSPWPAFIAESNPPPMLVGSDRRIPSPPTPQIPLWEGPSLKALVQYLGETQFADVAQGITILDPSALPEVYLPYPIWPDFEA